VCVCSLVVLPCDAAAMWTVQPASTCSEGLLWDETCWCTTKRHHLWLL